MKKIAAITAAILFPVCLAWADDAHHPDKTPVPDQAPLSQAQAKDAEPSTMPMMSMMQDNMKKMQEQMSKMRQTKNSKEKKKLMQEHMQAMQEHMKMMQGMMSSNMMAGGDTAGETMPPLVMEQRMKMMEQRMDMMQQMQQQMGQHQDSAAQMQK